MIPGHTIWLCGLSGAGKSTLANALISTLRTRGIPVLALDGDALRNGVCHGLGFSAADRMENLRRAAGIARLAADSSYRTAAETGHASHDSNIQRTNRTANPP